MSTFSSYLPAPQDLTPEQIQTVRSVLTAWLAAADLTLDTAPNTPFGDLHLSPAAQLGAAADVALERVIGDHDLQNIAAGGAFNCEVAERFVRNFHPTMAAAQMARGYVRFVFTSDEAREIDRSIALNFDILNGTTAGMSSGIFYPLLYSAGPLQVLPVGSAFVEGQNTFVLRQISESEYGIDVPVYGEATVAVPAGRSAQISATVAGLSRVYAIGAFTAGSTAADVKVLAQLASTQVYASSFSCRFGAVAFLQREFPDLAAASVTLAGDAEMARDTVTPLGVARACMDIWVRGPNVGILETATVRLPFYAVQGATVVRKFIGRLHLPAHPVLIEDVVATDADSLSLSVKILSRSTDSEAPLLAGAHSMQENLWIAIDMPVSPSTGADAIPLAVEADGTQYGTFTITYRGDSAVEAVTQCISSDDVRPANVRTLVRGFLPVHIKRLTVRLRREPGTFFKEAQARAELVTYFNSLGYPARVSEAHVADIVRYAGGTYLGAGCIGDLIWSLGTHTTESAVDPETDWAAAEAAAKAVPNHRAITLPQLNFTVRDASIGTAGEKFFAAGARNLGYVIDADNITFVTE